MKDHALIKLLRSFTKEEMKDFGEFASNSYFNKRKAVKKLFDILKKQYPDFEDKGSGRTAIYKKLFPGKRFSDKSLTVITHYLMELAKKFIVLRRFESDELEYDFMLQSELFKRINPGNTEKNLKKHLDQLDHAKYFSELYYYYKYKIKFEIMFYLYESNSGSYEKLIERVDLTGLYRDFYSHYLLKSMRLYLNILNTEKIYNKEYPKDVFEKMFDTIDTSFCNDIPIIGIYYNLILMIAQNSDKAYFKVKELLNTSGDNINIEDLTEVYINMQNFIKKKLTEGKMHFQKEEFELVTKQLESRTYLVNDRMSFIFYRNAVNTALRNNQLKWVKEFILDFKDDLQENFRDNAFYFCSAQYEFAMKNYDASLELLSKTKFDDIYQKYDTKTLQIMIYYETGSHESMLSSIEAFRQFLSNNDMLPELKKRPYSSFYKYFSRLLSIKKKNDKHSLEKLKEKMMSEFPLHSKDWLIRKADKLLYDGNVSRKVLRA